MPDGSAAALPSAPDPAVLGAAVARFTEAGHLLGASVLLGALRAGARTPLASAIADRAEAALLLRTGRPREAVALLQSAAHVLNDTIILEELARAWLEAGDGAQAASVAAEAVMREPRRASAQHALGRALNVLGRCTEAAICLSSAQELAPADPSIPHDLAEAQERGGERSAAVATLAAAVERWPAVAGLRVAAMLLALRDLDPARAIALGTAARATGHVDACVLGLLGHALSMMDRNEDANEIYAEALKLAPEDAYVRHLASAGGAATAQARAPVSYVQTVFDGYAPHFESHLMRLGYRIPGLVRAELLPLVAANGRLGSVLDLGCGTGFVAVALSDLPVESITGIDVSSAMLHKAAEKGIYADLIEGDIETVLAAESRSWEIIIAADVLCYFGDLQAVFTAVRTHLAPRGHFIFSVEQGADPATWALGHHGRYAHGPGYVHQAARQAGLAVRMIRAEAVREEGGAPVPGLFGILERNDHDPDLHA